MDRAPAFWRLICGAVMALAGLPSQAETIHIRAGEHAGYTRLVLETAPETDWQLGRVPGGYELRLTDQGLSFDTSSIFDRVPRSRLADVGSTDTAGVLALAVTCECHAQAFVTSNGHIVVDIAAGPPAASSPFEQQLQRATEPESVAPDPVPSREPQPAAKATPGSGMATLAFRPGLNQEASLPIYWRNLQVPTAATSTLPIIDVPLAVVPQTTPQISPPADHITRPTQNVAPPFPTLLPLPVEGRIATIALPQLPFPVPKPATAAIETALLHQLSRAAAQGLVKIDAARQGPGGAKANGLPDRPDTVQSDVPANATGPDDTDQADPDNHMEFHAETSIDRDSAQNPMPRHVTADGESCLSNEALDVANWGDERPATVQITNARGLLSGEFDRPDVAAVEKLARLYLFFGMGAEASQTLTAFSIDESKVKILTDIADILDDRPVAAESALHGMRDCDTAAALWAFLAAPVTVDVRVANVSAIVRAFSGLPGHLRYLLGQRVSNRLIAIDADDAAKSIRNAVARQAKNGDRVVSMLDAEIDLGLGKAEQAEKSLDVLTHANDALSAEAVILTIQSRLDRGEAIDPKLIETIAALAFEHRASADSAIFAHAEILAHAAGGDFVAAFNSYLRWKNDAPEAARGDTALQLFNLLASKAQDRDFMNAYFTHRDLLPEAGPDIGLRLDLAGRLAGLGFAEDLREVLTGEAGYTERGRRLLARADLDLFEPEKALAQVKALNGNDVLGIRAEAYAMLGDHLTAADALDRIGATEAAAKAAWAGGDWARAARGDDTLKAALRGLGLTAPKPPEPTGRAATLKNSKAILENSTLLRQTLNDLLGPPAADPALPAQ